MIKILVVDDDDRMQAMYVSVIKAAKLGEVETICASNGVEGLREVEKCKPDLIILDGNMPIMGGIETLSRLKKDEGTRYIPVFVISGEVCDRGIKTKAESLGAEIVLEKPVGMKVLLTLIRGKFFA